MRRRRPNTFVDVAACIELLETRHLLSADPTTLGTQTQSPIDATGSQSGTKIATDGGGDYVIIWESYGQSGLSSTIYAQEFNSTGNVLGTTLIVNPNSSTSSGQPAVAMNSAGEFVIAWTTLDQNGNGSSVNVQRYGPGGIALGNETTFADTLTGNQSSPSVAIDSKGDFVVAWVNEAGPESAEHIDLQRFDAGGAEEGSIFQVGQSTTTMQDQPSVAMDAVGDFVVTWQSVAISGDIRGITAQLYNSSGTAVGGELNVTSTTSVNPAWPSVAIDPTGDFVIAWQNGNSGQTNIDALRFNAAHQNQGGPLAVSDGNLSQNNMTPTVAMDAAGNFVVAWVGNLPGSSASAVFAQRYNASGMSEGDAEQFSASTTINQQSASVALQPDGSVIVAWSGQLQSNNSSGVYFQQSGPSAASQTGPVPVVPTGITGIIPPILPSALADSLPLLGDEDQFGILSNVDPFFFNPVIGIPADLQFYPQLLWGTEPLWFETGINPLYYLVW